jgi:hypothetical protein
VKSGIQPYSWETTLDGLLRLIGDEVDTFDHIHVPTAFHRLGKLSSASAAAAAAARARLFHDEGASAAAVALADDDGFKALLVLARVMCADGRLKAQGVANVVHAVATMHG